ncbi:MAG: acyltransferase [Sphingopyxis sp.]
MHDEITQSPYRTLDGIRGIAATIVMTRHLPEIYGRFTFPSCYLAVDLFFVLSGFVIANAYGARLEGGMGAREFMRIRMIRFYPLYALGFLIGIVDVALRIYSGDGGDWSGLALSFALIAGLFMLPAPGTHEGGLYPINTPSWSLGYEVAVNILYGFIHRWLSTKVLIAIMAVSAAGVLRYTLYFNSVNFGDGWDTIPAGTTRVCYSFFAGVLVWRFRGVRAINSLGALTIAALVALILMAQIEAALFDFTMVMIGFPAIVWAAARVEPGQFIAPLFIKLGVASYGVYVLHTPLGRIIEQSAKNSGYTIPIPILGVAFIIALTLLVLWIDRLFDKPVRKYLLRVTVKPQSTQALPA